MDASTIAIVIRIFAILGAGGFVAYRFREISDLKSAAKAIAGIFIAILFIVTIWVIADPIAELIGAF